MYNWFSNPGILFFFLRAKYNGAFRYAQDNLGVQKVSAPSKNLEKSPSICFALDKKINFQDIQNQRYISIFMSQREREYKSAGNFISKPPGTE